MQPTITRLHLGSLGRATRQALCLGAICLSAACGGGAQQTGGTTPVAQVEVAAPVRHAEPIDYLPADSFVLAKLDFNHLRSSPYVHFVDQWLELLRGSAQQSGGDDLRMYEALASLYRETDSLWLGVAAFDQGAGSRITQSGADVPPRIVLVLHGSYQEGEIERLIREAPGSQTDHGQIETRDGHLVLSATRHDAHLLLADQSTVVVAIDVGIEQALAVANGAEPGLRAGGRLRSLAEESGFGQHVFDLTVVATPEARQALAAGASSGGTDAALTSAFAETLQYLTGSVALQDGIQIGARIQTSNRLSAAAITQQINAKIDQAASQPALGLIGLADPIRQARAHMDGTASVVELNMDDAQTRALFERLNGLVMLAIGMMNQQGPEVESTDVEPTQESPSRF